ncbi:MAG TPA: TIM barrel protein [Thermomicrobiales bacterium]
MRLGGPIGSDWDSPESWVAAVRQHGYGAAYCPLTEKDDAATIAAYAAAAAGADIVIAEVGAWSNPISPDPEISRAAIAYCQSRLALAEAIGARCCVNIAGSRGASRGGPHPANLTPDTFALIVDTVRTIIDAVRPTRTVYALEAMPWIFPDSPDTYLALLDAIDRPGCAAHFDPVNWVVSPRTFYDTAALIRESVAKLGPRIRSCHAKDIALLDGRAAVQFDEVRPGLGGLDYRVFLRELDRLDPDLPLMLEHLPSLEEYAVAGAHIRAVAAEEGLTLGGRG